MDARAWIVVLIVLGTVLPSTGVAATVIGLHRQRRERRKRPLIVADLNAEFGADPPSLRYAWRGLWVNGALVIAGLCASAVAGAWSLYL
ncbi:MAG TPA: hypothetical protein VGM94_17455 [Galbitalea sp.]